MDNIIINKLPAPTWKTLKMNFAEVQGEEFEAYPTDKLGLSETGSAGIETGCGSELTALLDKSGIPVLRAESSGSVNIAFDEGKSLAARFEIEAKENSELKLIELISSGKSGRGAVQTVINAAEGAKVHLVQVIACGSGFEMINDIGTAQADRASVEITQLYVGGKRTLGGIFASLDGYKSELTNDIGYIVSRDEELDINITASHKGRKTNSLITAKGVLDGNARKLFRGTIDFIKGAAGAVGSENEDVLLMNEEAENKTVPLILCSEEDVEGSHGASIGRIDDEYVFYMMSRGLSIEKIYAIMADSKLEYAIKKADDDSVRAAVYKAIGRGDDNE